MARNQSEKEPTVEGIPEPVLEVIRADVRAGAHLSTAGCKLFNKLSAAHERAYAKWSFAEKNDFFERYKAWLRR